MSKKLDKKLYSVKFTPGSKPHIKIKTESCKGCVTKKCLIVCPAKNYSENEKGEITVACESCFECGACRVICTKNAIEWQYPFGGLGVTFRYG